MVKARSVEQNDQHAAKLAWCYEQILTIQQKYLTAFKKMKDGLYYDAWSHLERVEIELHFLEPHFASVPEGDCYRIAFIEKHARQFQSLFPYKAFLSPAFLYLEKVCSICSNVVSIRNPCGHKKGEIYDGEMCAHEIRKGELLELSYVTNPVQKYSVLFFTDPQTGKQIDHYDYQSVKYVIDGLRNPFDAWDVHWTKIRHPHSLFAHLGRNENCPCGSGRKYKNCCLRESGVLRPHVEILFSVPPPENLPRIVYPNNDKNTT